LLLACGLHPAHMPISYVAPAASVALLAPLAHGHVQWASSSAPSRRAVMALPPTGLRSGRSLASGTRIRAGAAAHLQLLYRSSAPAAAVRP